jgi:hypothetical protein
MGLAESPFRFSLLFGHDLFGKPVPTFPDHAMILFTHDLFGKPVPTFPDHAMILLCA